VLLAEGFTNPQQSDFNLACSAFVTALTGTDPFGQVAHALNVFRVNVASNQPGADDPVADRNHRHACRRTTIFVPTSRGCSADTPTRTARSFDSTSLGNGLHTISWVVRDDAGAFQGVGSRFFTVQN